MPSISAYLKSKDKYPPKKAVESSPEPPQDVSAPIEETIPKASEVSEMPAMDIEEYDKDLDTVSEENFEEYLEETKRSILQMLRSHLQGLRKKVASGNYTMNEKEFLGIQKIFDSMWKQEIAREGILLKRRKESRADAMAVFDIYGRYGSVDEPTLITMRQALYGNNNPTVSGVNDPEAVAVVVSPDTGTPVPKDGATEEGA